MLRDLDLLTYFRGLCACAVEQTLAASATISGNSIAVTSFSAGREFATSTTCKIRRDNLDDYSD